MYNLLIVDDEKIIREGIISVLEDQFNCFNVFAAKNGEKALRQIKEKEIEGMILDIKMPVMDGLELLKQLERENIKIPTLILSGYDEFEYAQKALKYMAIDYVLKPVVPDDIEELSIKLKDEIESRQKEEEEYRELKRQVKDSRSMVKERLFYDILNGKIDEEKFNEKVDILNLNCTGNFYRVVLIELETKVSNKKIENMNSIIEKSLQKYRDKKRGCSLFRLNSDILVLLFSYKRLRQVNDEENLNLIKNIKKKIQLGKNSNITLGIGKQYSGINQIKRSYYQALTALRYKLVMGQGNIYNIKNFEDKKEDISLEIDMEEIRIFLKTEQSNKVVNNIKNTFSLLKKAKKPDIYSVYLLSSKYLVTFMSCLKEYGINLEMLFGDRMNPFTELLNKNSIDELQEWLLNMLTKIHEYIQEYRNNKEISTIEKIKKYVRENYNENLNNKKISRVIGYSPNYLGKIFKDETGITINEYLNKTRINKAKNLLNDTQLMIYEIAYKVGYNDEHYFSSVFKRFVGVTPGEYRDF